MVETFHIILSLHTWQVIDKGHRCVIIRAEVGSFIKLLLSDHKVSPTGRVSYSSMVGGCVNDWEYLVLIENFFQVYQRKCFCRAYAGIHELSSTSDCTLRNSKYQRSYPSFAAHFGSIAAGCCRSSIPSVSIRIATRLVLRTLKGLLR